MGFKELKRIYRRILWRKYNFYPTSVELDEWLAKLILEPFESFEDALEHARMRMAYYTVEGFSVSPSAIRKAVEIMSKK